MNSPDIDGYTLIRGDRIGAENPGGGVLTLVNKDIIYDRNGFSNRNGIELLGISVQLSNRKWLTLNNYYIPPDDPIDLSWIPLDPDSVHAGDFNGHTQLWDHIQPTDDRGEQILDWMLENNLTCLNDGTPTRINRGTGGLSTSDITLVSDSLKNKVKWSVISETTMGADHSPIVCDIKTDGIQTISNTPMRTCWKSQNINW